MIERSVECELFTRSIGTGSTTCSRLVVEVLTGKAAKDGRGRETKKSKKGLRGSDDINDDDDDDDDGNEIRSPACKTILSSSID